MGAEIQAMVPSFDQLLWPTIKALKATGGSASNEELLAKIIELEGISESVQALIHTDNRQTKVAYNLAWAKTYLIHKTPLAQSWHRLRIRPSWGCPLPRARGLEPRDAPVSQDG